MRESKALFTRRKSEVVISTKAKSLGVSSKKSLMLKSRNLESEVVFASCCRVTASLSSIEHLVVTLGSFCVGVDTDHGNLNNKCQNRDLEGVFT